MAIRNLLAQVTQRGARFGCNSGQFVAPELGDKVFDEHFGIFACRKDLVKNDLCSSSIPQFSAYRLNGGMDKNQNRKQWLRVLKIKEGSNRQLAAKLGTDENYLSTIMSPNGNRNLGDDLARRAEDVYGLPPGVMDLPSEAAQKLITAADGMEDSDLEKVLEFMLFMKSGKKNPQ